MMTRPLLLVACCLARQGTDAWQQPWKRSTHHIGKRLNELMAQALDSGSIVEFTDKASRVRLGLVQGTDPKTKNGWLVEDGDGTMRSVLAKQVAAYTVAPSSAAPSASALETLVSAAQRAIDDPDAAEALELAWEMAREEADPALRLSDLADLLVPDLTGNTEGAEAYVGHYAAKQVCDSPNGKCYFKPLKLKKGETEIGSLPYGAREVEDRDNLLKALALGQEREKKREALRSAVEELLSADSGAPSKPWADEFESDESLAPLREALPWLERLGCLAPDPWTGPNGDAAAQADMAELIGSLPPNDQQEVSLAVEFLKDELGRKATPATARQLLVGLGVWDEHENLELIKRRLPVAFPARVDAAAAALLQAAAAAAEEDASLGVEDEDASSRRDLTHLRCFAIDDEDTTEVDDAISIETDATDAWGNSVTRVWIHVADPSRFLRLGDVLETEASVRKQTLYLPTGSIPMLPPALGAGPFSLGGGQGAPPGTATCALSFGCILRGGVFGPTSAATSSPGSSEEETAADSDDEAGGLVLEELVVTPSLVKAERLTYQEADAILQGDEGDEGDEAKAIALRSLWSVANARLAWRCGGGSIEAIAPVSFPDARLKASKAASGAWGVTLEGVAAGPSRAIVTECMLLAGEAAASFAVDNQIPMPFRCQALRPPRGGATLEEEEAAVLALPAGLPRRWAAMRRMGPSSIAKTALPHEGLGLDAYAQVTSPIRRHADLVCHFQLKAFLRGEPLPFPGHPTDKANALPSPGEAAGDGAEGGETAAAHGRGSDIVAACAGDTSARDVQRFAEQHWRAVYCAQSLAANAADAANAEGSAAVPLLSATVLAEPRAPRAGGGEAAPGQAVLVHELGTVMDLKGGEPKPIGSTLQVALSANGVVTAAAAAAA